MSKGQVSQKPVGQGSGNGKSARSEAVVLAEGIDTTAKVDVLLGDFSEVKAI